ncbi:hypothetical protein GGR21_003748 [Dysgonomonas hofstadii]|uniref:DUF4251 domain-containing protein n=1 Tax=Dysgonomonas hofstadii TaxID=637886 RepID=A0A840CNZ8_9BACT|nr:DUF4251 domain-containing protein [Dysgonomonas hofstadii]MBB4037827.1 hypothetical protein [Dysgonomonas hofstadii]
MKTYASIIVLGLSLLFFSCKSTDSVTKAEQKALITQKIEGMNYKFVPRTANPSRGNSINLNYSYYLKVNKDTVSAYLPYFGRAYSAPYGGDGGINILSTDFEYTIKEKKTGEWDISINIKDDQKRYELNLSAGDTGYGSLSVRDNNRSPISFYGSIE